MERFRLPLALTVAFVLVLSACDSMSPDGGYETALAPSSNAEPVLIPFPGEPVPDPGTPEPLYRIVSGRLHFTSQAAYDQTYSDLTYRSQDQIATAIVGFTSMLRAEQLDAAAADAGTLAPEKVRSSVVEDPYLASLLSPAGLVQIGSTLYKVGIDQVFTGVSTDATKFQTSTESQLVSTAYPRYTVVREAQTAPVGVVKEVGGVIVSASYGQGQMVSKSSMPIDTRCSTVFTGTNGSQYRTCGTSYITNWKFSRAAGAATNGFKRKTVFGIAYYLPIRTDNLTMTSTYQIAREGSPLPASQTRTTAATGKWFIHHFVYVGWPGGAKIYGNVRTTHGGTHAGTAAPGVSTNVSRAAGAPA